MDQSLQSSFKKLGITDYAVGLVQETQSATFFGGGAGENSLFQIGSLTKLFTGYIFERLSAMGVISLEDTVGKFLPNLSSVEGITIRHLLMHTSGIPRLPSNLNPKDAKNPYLEYSEQDLISFFTDFKLDETRVGSFDYSNLGYALLGLILTAVENDSYERTLAKYLLVPLGMKNTYINIPESRTKDIVQGHNSNGEAVPLWNAGVFVAAGGVVSDIKDMLAFLTWNLNNTSPLLSLAFDDGIYWHNGMTGGYSSYLGFSLEKQTGVVILSSKAVPVDDLGIEVLKSTPLD